MPELTKIQTGFLEPQGAFELDPGTASSPGLFFSGNTSTGMFSPSSGVLGFSTGSTQQALTILSNGYVGIGTDNPVQKLEVYGNARFKATDGSHGIELYPDVSGLGYQRIISYNRTSSTYENLSFGVNDFIVTNGGTAENFRIKSSGNVGIGTDDPSSKLHLYSAGPQAQWTDSDNDSDSRIRYNENLFIFEADSFDEIADSAFSFRVDGTNIANEKLRITSSGNVGIGTDNPDHKLDVRGEVQIIGTTGDTMLGISENPSYIRNVNDGTNTGGNSILQMGGNASSYVIAIQDGRGRVQHSWNATVGGSEEFLVGGENAFWLEMSPDSDGELFKLRKADGSTASAGDAISWTPVFGIDTTGLKYWGGYQGNYSSFQIIPSDPTSTTYDPTILRLKTNESSAGATTLPGDVYGAIEFAVHGAEINDDQSTGQTVTNDVIAAIKAIDWRDNATSNEDAGIGFYTTEAGVANPALTFRGGFSNDGAFYVGDNPNQGNFGGKLHVDWDTTESQHPFGFNLVQTSDNGEPDALAITNKYDRDIGMVFRTGDSNGANQAARWYIWNDGANATEANNNRFNISPGPSSSITNGITILQNNNVGISKGSPEEKLHVTGNIKLEAGAPFIKYAETGVTGNPVFWVGQDGGNFSFRLNNSAPYPFQIVTKGANSDAIDYVAIGGETEQARFKVTAPTTQPTYVDLTSNDNNTRIRFYETTTERWNIGYDTSIDAFTFYDSQASNTRIRIYDGASGGVVIGTEDHGGFTYPTTDGGGAATSPATLRIDGGDHAALFCYTNEQSGDPVAIFAKGNEADDNATVLIVADGDGDEEVLDIRTATDPTSTANKVALLDFARDSSLSKFRVYGDGRVYTPYRIGVGTTDPSSPLDVIGNFEFRSPDANDTTNTKIVGQFDGTGTRNTYLRIGANENRRASIVFSGLNTTTSTDTNYWSIGRGDSDELDVSSFFIATGESGGNTAKLVIDSNGNVGIGITNPSDKLSVVGDSRIDGILQLGDGTTTDYQLNVETPDSGNNDNTRHGQRVDINGWKNDQATKYGLLVDIDTTATDDITANRTKYGIFSSINTYAPSNASTTTGTQYNYQGIRSELIFNDNPDTNYTAGKITQAYAAYNRVRIDSAGGASNVRGCYNQVQSADNANGTSYTIDNAYGTYSYVVNDGDHTTFDNAYGVYSHVNQDDTGGAMNTAYGVYSRMDRDAGTGGDGYAYYGIFEGEWATKFGIYLSGENRNYFSGNVGIGTTDPVDKLHVIGGAVISSDTATLGNNYASLIIGERAAGDGYASLEFKNDADNFSCKLDATESNFSIWTNKNSVGQDRFVVNYGSTTEYIALRPLAQDVLHVQYDSAGGGRVGIGTNNPNRQLHISSPGESNIILENTGGATDQKKSRVYTTSGSSPDFLITFLNDAVTSETNILRATRGTGTNVSQIHLAPTGGNVGIGTDNPAEKLHVNGAIVTGTNNIGTCAKFGSGGAVSITLNDGYGNANLCFNHEDGRADANGSAARIRAAVDGSVGLIEFFAIDNVTAGSIYAVSTSDRSLAISSTHVDVGHTSDNKDLNVYGNTTMSGWLEVTGSLTKGSGSFKIDHPLPEKSSTHHLVHSFVESPQADNIYRGRATLVDGVATINLDDEAGMTEGTFVLLNRDIQCFTSNESDWDAVRGNVVGNILTIECQNSSSTAIVSWLVIGERQDAHMYETDWTDEDGKVIVEPLKKSN